MRARRPSPLPTTTEAEEERVRNHAIAYFRPELYEELTTLKGHMLGDWRVESLYAIGGVGILLRVRCGRRRGLLKMPNMPYDRPSHFGVRELNLRRKALAWEAEVLNTFRDSLFPALLDSFRAPNPLLTGRTDDVSANESYLVMELIDGRPLDLEMQHRLSNGGLKDMADCLNAWLTPLFGFLIGLKLARPALFYTDFKPSNVLIDGRNRLWLLDAGSISSSALDPPAFVSQGFRVPTTRCSYNGGASLEGISITALGHTLYASIGNRILHDRSTLSVEELEPVCGPNWAGWIVGAASNMWGNLETLAAHMPE